MPRYALKIEYDGAPFSGWQRQPNVPSVQGTIENAARKLEPDCELVQGAGRTDSGVHATGQVAHIDLVKEWDPFRLSGALNFHLKPAPVSILRAARVPEDFHARFSAVERSYTYRVVTRRAPMTFDKGNAWRVSHELDDAAMQEAANHLIGKHDFTTFRSSICQAQSPVKTLDELRVEVLALEYGHEYRFHIRARSFLHNQVRSFIGTLERVGAGSWPAERVKTALESADRSTCGPVAPAHGLYLAKVKYPDDPFSQR